MAASSKIKSHTRRVGGKQVRVKEGKRKIGRRIAQASVGIAGLAVLGISGKRLGKTISQSPRNPKNMALGRKIKSDSLIDVFPSKQNNALTTLNNVGPNVTAVSSDLPGIPRRIKSGNKLKRNKPNRTAELRGTGDYAEVLTLKRGLPIGTKIEHSRPTGRRLPKKYRYQETKGTSYNHAIQRKHLNTIKSSGKLIQSSSKRGGVQEYGDGLYLGKDFTDRNSYGSVVFEFPEKTVLSKGNLKNPVKAEGYPEFGTNGIFVLEADLPIKDASKVVLKRGPGSYSASAKKEKNRNVRIRYKRKIGKLINF